MKLSDFKPILENEAKFKDLVQISKIKGFVIWFNRFFKFEKTKTFPNWIGDCISFFSTVTEIFEEKEILWYKFLGNTFLYFILEEDNQNYLKQLKKLTSSKSSV